MKAEEIGTVYYSPEILKTLHEVFDSISDRTWHLIMNPYCPHCLIERGNALLSKE